MITNKHPKTLNASWFETPLGSMLAISDETSLWLLKFVEKHDIKTEIEKFQLQTNTVVVHESSPVPVIESIKAELLSYFDGSLKEFTTPLHLEGTPFQKATWLELSKIPYGQTKSYLDQAISMDKPTACRAVANANGANQIAIAIPCHRIINKNGKLGGYAGGVARKKWLLNHENQNVC